MKQFSLFDLQLLIVSQSSRDLDVNSNAVAGIQKKLKIYKFSANKFQNFVNYLSFLNNNVEGIVVL